MTTNDDGVWCGQCGASLEETAELRPEQRLPCPSCGSSKRRIAVSLTTSVAISTGMRMKGREPGRKEPFFEARAEPSRSVKLGRDVHLERVVDRRNDKYTETITDPVTGEVIHHCDEPLSEHRGHGSAKKKS